jgi:hypothetical protein
MALSLVLTMSRSGITALALAIAIMGAFVIRRQRTTRRAVTIGYLLLLVTVVVLGLAVGIGSLAKYTMLFVLPGLALYLWLAPERRSSLRSGSLAFWRPRRGSAVFAIEPLLATILVALALLLLELFPRIPMHSTGSPVASAGFSGFLKSAFRLLGRRPQLSALEPFHLRVWMPLLHPAQCWQEVLAFSGAKRSRESSGEDRPVRKAWRHWLLLSESLEFLDERRSLDVQ